MRQDDPLKAAWEAAQKKKAEADPLRAQWEAAQQKQQDDDGPGVLADVAAQAFAGPANLVTTVGEGLARLGSRLFDGYKTEPNILDKAADKLRERRDAVNEVVAPSTTAGKVANVVSNIGAQALPAVATGGTYGLGAGALASAATTGVQSQAGRDASITGLVGDLTDSPLIDKLADNPFTRTALDVGLDVGLSAASNKVASAVTARRAAKAATKGAEGTKPNAVLDAIERAKAAGVVDKVNEASDEAMTDLYKQFKADTAPTAPKIPDVTPVRRPLTVPIEEPLGGVVGGRTASDVANTLESRLAAFDQAGGKLKLVPPATAPEATGGKPRLVHQRAPVPTDDFRRMDDDALEAFVNERAAADARTLRGDEVRQAELREAVQELALRTGLTREEIVTHGFLRSRAGTPAREAEQLAERHLRDLGELGIVPRQEPGIPTADLADRLRRMSKDIEPVGDDAWVRDMSEDDLRAALDDQIYEARRFPGDATVAGMPRKVAAELARRTGESADDILSEATERAASVRRISDAPRRDYSPATSGSQIERESPDVLWGYVERGLGRPDDEDISLLEVSAKELARRSGTTVEEVILDAAHRVLPPDTPASQVRKVVQRIRSGAVVKPGAPEPGVYSIEDPQFGKGYLYVTPDGKESAPRFPMRGEDINDVHRAVWDEFHSLPPSNRMPRGMAVLPGADEGSDAARSIRTLSGKLPKNLRRFSDEDLEHEWARLAEQNASDEAAHASVMEAGYRADYEELPRTEKLGRRGQEDLPDADGMVDSERLAADNKVISEYRRAKAARASREKAMKRIELELARRGRPFGGSGEPFDVFSNPLTDPRVLRRAFGTRLGQSAALEGVGFGLSESEDEKLRATGNGLMILGGIHAVGAPRIRAAGGAVGGRLVDVMKQSETGVRALNYISRDILADPKVRALIDAYDEGMAGARARAAELSKRAKALGPSGDRTVSDLIEGESFEPLTTDQTIALGVAQRISDEFAQLGRAKVAHGLLSPETFAKREHTYLPRLYAKHLGEVATADRPSLESVIQGKKPRIRGEKMRLEDLLDETRNNLGEIREASFRTAYGIQKGYSDIAAVKLFEGLRDLPGIVHPEFTAGVEAVKAAQQSGDIAAIKAAKEALAGFSERFKNGSGGFVRLPDTKGMGVMRGAVVRKDVAEYLNGVPALGGKAGDLLAYWKRVHTVLNPGTHIGNVASNSVIAHMFGLPVWEQPGAIKAAAQDFDSYGPVTQFLAEKGILAHGLPTASEAVPGGGRSLKTTLTQLAGHTRLETARVLAEHGIVPRKAPFRAVGAVSSKLEDWYAKEDGVFRVATFTKLVNGGMEADEAADVVDRAFVNYTTHSPLLGTIKNTVSPFVMYPIRAIPAVTEQIIEHPWRWATLAAAWGGLDQMSRARVGKIAERDLRPADRTNKALGYLAPGFTQLPVKGSRGERYGVDLARFTPFSALTGAPAPGSTTFAAFGEKTPGILQPSGPWIDIGARLTNTDPYTGDKLVKPGDTLEEKLNAFASSAASLALPSAMSFQVPRVAGDLRDRDLKSAGIDALGIAGMRPRVIRPGMQALNEEREFEDARTQILSDLRRALKSNRDPKRALSLRLQAQQRLRNLGVEFQQQQAGGR